MTASRDSTARDSLLFPLLFTYADDCQESLDDAKAPDQYDPVTELQKIQRTVSSLSDAELQLSQAVQEAKASSILTTGAVDLFTVGSFLRSRYNYLVVLRQANTSKRPKAYLRQLRHDFLIVRGLPTMESVDVFVDLNFRDNFRVCHATPWYTKLLAALPQDWVGTTAALAAVVGLMSASMRLCFRQVGIPLPPWREGRAMLSKWVTELHNDQQVPLIPVPDPVLRHMLAPYHSPFRKAVEQAAAPAAATGYSALCSSTAGTTQQQQPCQQGDAGKSRAGLLLLPLAGYAADASAHNQQEQHAPDVPRKIIVGFPVASPPAAWPQQIVPDSAMSAAAGAAGGVHGPTGTCSSNSGSMQVQQPVQAPATAATTMQCKLASCTAPTTLAAMKAVVLPLQPVAAPPAAAIDTKGTAGALAELNPAARQGSQQTDGANCNASAAAAGDAARPASTSTAGVVVATAGGTSPGILVNKQWLQQLVARQPGKGVAATAAGAGGGGSGGAKAAAEGSPASAVAAAASAAVAARQFKSLDQLLPRMRTVKLGAG